jgi:hypothetical protein
VLERGLDVGAKPTERLDRRHVAGGVDGLAGEQVYRTPPVSGS